jgi:regulator-associated protein of mTOR
MGTSSGSLSMMDFRCAGGGSSGNLGVWSAADPMLYRFQPHQLKKWVVRVACQRVGSCHGFVSGSVNGDLSFWDMRRAVPVTTVRASTPDMTCLAVHDYAPLVAVGSSRKQYIQLLSASGELKDRLCYHNGFAGQRLGPLSCLDFHRNSLLLAAGANDEFLAVFQGKVAL